MKPINLLPRVPLSRRLFKPVIAAIILLTAAAVTGIVMLLEQYKETNRNFELEIARLDGQMMELAASEQPPRYADVTAYRSLVEQLERTGRDWGPVFEIAEDLLPRASAIASITAEADGRVRLEVRMPGLSEIAAYSAALRESEPVADAAVIEFELEGLMSSGADLSGAMYSAVIELQLADQTGTGEAGP